MPQELQNNYCMLVIAAAIRRFATAHPDFVQDVAAKAAYCA